MSQASPHASVVATQALIETKVKVYPARWLASWAVRRISHGPLAEHPQPKPASHFVFTANNGQSLEACRRNEPPAPRSPLPAFLVVWSYERTVARPPTTSKPSRISHWLLRPDILPTIPVYPAIRAHPRLALWIWSGRGRGQLARS